MWSRVKLIVARKRKLLLLVVILLVGLRFMNMYRPEVRTSDTQGRLDYMSKYLQVKLAVLGNKRVAVKLNNTGLNDISDKNWRIYFFTLRRPPDQSTASGLSLQRENGGLYFISPTEQFEVLKSHQTITMFIENFPGISKSDHTPNWYVVSSAADNSLPRSILSTCVKDQSFIEPFTEPSQWKQDVDDRYHPYTPEERYQMNSLINEEKGATQPGVNDYIIPTPNLINHKSDQTINIDNTWTIVSHSKLFEVSGYFAEQLKRDLRRRHIEETSRSTSHVILFNIVDGFSIEEYRIEVSTSPRMVNISCNTEKAAFYAIQSLLSLMSDSGSVPHVVIHDKPRFPVRGIMVDTVRNFFPKKTILKVIDLMARYKLNVLHLHLTDDEGWRVEMPSIPELTQFASRRCHNNIKNRCLPPSLGSGPHADLPGSGFYTVSDFREILQYASKRFIKVIPEIDVPGHSYAAVLAMKFREDVILRRSESGGYSDPSYMLIDADHSQDLSVQGWGNNSMNPCMNATYRFIDTVIGDLKTMYEGIQNLDVIHLGGDEVPANVWASSPACQNILDGRSYDHQMMRRIFMIAAGEIAFRRELDLITWEDGMYNSNRGEGPYQRELFKQRNVYVQAWKNVWDEGTGGLAIVFANAGYKTILSPATHLYFDHPYEPDPEEKGLYWAARYTDTFKVFGFMPDDIFENADFDRNGNEISKETVCSTSPCPSLKNPENVVGMEACLWSETVQNEEQLFYMLLPRLIAFAERSWHKATWESIPQKMERDRLKLTAWGAFLNALGTHELPELEKQGFSYRIPPPGVHFDRRENTVTVNSLYPNHDVQMSVDNGANWTPVPCGTPLKAPKAQTVRFRTMSALSQTHSRSSTVVLDAGAGLENAASRHYMIWHVLTLNVILTFLIS